MQPTPTPRQRRGKQPKDAVRRLREAAGLSQAELARRAKVSRSLVCEIEAGTRGINPTVLVGIASALEVQPTDIDPDAKPAPAENLLTIPQVVERLGAGSRATVYRLIRAGQLDRVNIGTGSRPRSRITPDSLAAYVARQTVPGRKTAAA